MSQVSVVRKKQKQNALRFWRPVIGRATFRAVALVLGPQTDLAIVLSSTTRGGQGHTKYVALEFQWHATFVADESSGIILEPL